MMTLYLDLFDDSSIKGNRCLRVCGESNSRGACFNYNDVIMSMYQTDRQKNLYSYIDGLIQERRNSIANALELRLSRTNPSTSLLFFVMSVFRKSLQIICNGGTPAGLRVHIAHQSSNAWSDSGTVRSPILCNNSLICHIGIMVPLVTFITNAIKQD